MPTICNPLLCRSCLLKSTARKGYLGWFGDAAVGAERADAALLARLLHDGGDLESQLPGGGQDQHHRPVGCAPHSPHHIYQHTRHREQTSSGPLIASHAGYSSPARHVRCPPYVQTTRQQALPTGRFPRVRASAEDPLCVTPACWLARMWMRPGSPNARVLPEPVAAMPMRSRPEAMMGQQLAWIGDGCEKVRVPDRTSAGKPVAPDHTLAHAH